MVAKAFGYKYVSLYAEQSIDHCPSTLNALPVRDSLASHFAGTFKSPWSNWPMDSYNSQIIRSPGLPYSVQEAERRCQTLNSELYYSRFDSHRLPKLIPMRYAPA
jgi:hypothetical protein